MHPFAYMAGSLSSTCNDLVSLSLPFTNLPLPPESKADQQHDWLVATTLTVPASAYATTSGGDAR
jgi:hypothetical protein